MSDYLETTGETEVPLLSEIVAAYGFTVTGQQEVELLKQIATQQCGVSVANLGDQEVELLKQIALYYGTSVVDLGQQEVELLKQIVTTIPGSTITTATLGDTEIPLLTQWLSLVLVPPITTWILETGFWNDSGTWVDSATWID